MTPNGNVQPQYAAQRSIVGCTVLPTVLIPIRLGYIQIYIQFLPLQLDF